MSFQWPIQVYCHRKIRQVVGGILCLRGAALELLPESETPFFTTAVPFAIEFQKERDGSVKRAKAWHCPEELEGKKVGDISKRNPPVTGIRHAS
jgi:hypothetical protein